MRIGPEPTTDNFHVIEHAEEDGKIPGENISSSFYHFVINKLNLEINDRLKMMIY